MSYRTAHHAMINAGQGVNDGETIELARLRQHIPGGVILTGNIDSAWLADGSKTYEKDRQMTVRKKNEAELQGATQLNALIAENLEEVKLV